MSHRRTQGFRVEPVALYISIAKYHSAQWDGIGFQGIGKRAGRVADREPNFGFGGLGERSKAWPAGIWLARYDCAEQPDHS
jgi:hypothetical protein